MMFSLFPWRRGSGGAATGPASAHKESTMNNDLQTLHDFLTNIGAISVAHVVTAAQNGEIWACDRTNTPMGKIRAAIAETDTLTPGGAGLRSFDLGSI